jgi:hypothetical protein
MSRPSGRSRKGRSMSPAYLRLVHDTTARPAPAPAAPAAPGAPGADRRRVEIVPLEGPAGSPPMPRLAPVTPSGDRRQVWPGRDADIGPAPRLMCTSCRVPARIDVVDLRTKRLHMSCDRCYRMWQDQVRTGDTVSAGLQRNR